MTQVMDVIVIGCGASGIAALRKLHDAGLNVLGLEAADRIGGRIHSIKHGDCYLDLGAAWCHGEKDNVVYELANPLGLLGRPHPKRRCFIKSDGELVSGDKAVSIADTIKQIITNSKKNNTTSISEYLRNSVKSNDDLQNTSELIGPFIAWYERNNHVGGQNDPSEGKSLKGLDEYWSSDGEFFLNWKGRGYKTIFDILLNKYTDPNDATPIEILLNKEVENIKWGTSRPGLDPGNPLVQIKCKDGSLYAAKSVIVTVSLGVLKERHYSLFNPELPQEKINAINNLKQCILDKIYIEFSCPWWKGHTTFNILWRDEDKAQFDQDLEWVTEIYAMETVEYYPNMLLAWIYGNGAKVMEGKSGNEIKKGVVKLLKIVFKQFDITLVNSVTRSKWASNPLIRGTYSYRSVATEENGDSAEILSQPIYYNHTHPIVCFAGEATSHHRHGAVHGAIEAGFREADTLIAHFKDNAFVNATR